MTPRRAWFRRGIAGVGLAAPLALAPVHEVTLHAADTVITEPALTAGMVAVTDIASTASSVTGTLVNRTPGALRNLRLMVSDSFVWTPERNPGADDPSRASWVSVTGPIPPRGSVPFRFDRPAALPDRPDGHFRTEIAVVGMTRQSPPGTL